MEIDEYKKVVASRITNRREALGLSQRAFAKVINVLQPQVNRWETGNHLPDLYNAYWISKGLQISMDELFRA